LGYSWAVALISIAFAAGVYLSVTATKMETATSTQVIASTAITTSTITIPTTSTSVATSTSTSTIVTTSTTLVVNTGTVTTTSTSTRTTNVTVTYTTTGPGVQMIASPTSGTPNQNITVVGRGLPPGLGVALALENGSPPNYATVSVSNFTTKEDGTFSTSFLVPNLPAGAYLLTCNASGITSVSFEVIPSITVSPSSGMPSISVTIVGRGFAANSTVYLDMGSFILAERMTDSNGGFNVMITIPGSLSHQTYLIIASDSSDNTASANFTVT